MFPRPAVVSTLLLVTGLAGACASAPGRDSQATVTRELIVPYLAALDAGDVEVAWRDFTTDGYKRATSLIAYEAGQARNVDELGAHPRAVLLADAPVPLTEPGHPPMLRFTARWEGERSNVTVVLDVVDLPPWRIERTWVWPDDRLGTERVF